MTPAPAIALTVYTSLEQQALAFEKWATEQGADPSFMRYARSSLRKPDFVALFAGGPDGPTLNQEQAKEEMRAHIRGLKRMLQRRLERPAVESRTSQRR